LLEEKVDELPPFFVEPYRVRWTSIAETLITVEIASIKAVEKMPEAVRVRSIPVSYEPEIKRIVHP
jgi:hypothetical protein